MPARNQVKTLKKYCLRRIALCFECYFMKEYNEYFKDMPRILYVNGAFDLMTNETIQGVIDHLISEERLKRNHLSLLLQESVVDLNLSKGGAAVNHDWVLTLTSLRCPRLTKLNLAGLKNVNNKIMSDCFRGMPGLKCLILSRTLCNDQVMSVLGHHCLELQELDLCGTPVRDPGMFSLCQACKPDIGCKKLSKLHINETMISTKGALHALQNLPRLQILDCDNIFTVIEKDIKEKEKSRIELQPYRLKKLEMDEMIAPSEQGGSVTLKLCPFVQSLRCLTSYLPHNSIQLVLGMKYLNSLYLINDGSFSYNQGVLPLVKAIGHQLEQLSLIDIRGVDLISIGVNCPNLKTLSLGCPSGADDSSYIYINLPATEKRCLFKTLKEITLHSSDNVTIFNPKSALISLLKAAKSLHRVSLVCGSFLNTADLLEIYKENPLSELMVLDLYGSLGIEKEAIFPLLGGENELDYLNLKYCRDITRADFEEFQNVVSDSNFDLKIVWE